MDRLTDAAQLDGWIPVRFYWREGQPMVDWCYLGRKRFADSFFEHTVNKLMALPFNLLFRQQTPISVLDDLHEARPGLKPTGFIFHMSRCGSTLITQMLAVLSGTVVISEARPLDSVLRAHFRSTQVTDKQRIAWFQWMVSALGQKILGNEKYFLIKFDAWNISELPFIQRAFPDVPWIFNYREPVEVLVSQINHRGPHMVPGVIDPTLFGMNVDEIATVEPEEYCARVLGAICEAGLRYSANGGLLINYEELPEATWRLISEFFGLGCNEAEIEMMKNTAKLDAKNPAMIFERDSIKKQQQASERVREAARKWVAPVYEKLEAARKRQFPNIREPKNSG